MKISIANCFVILLATGCLCLLLAFVTYPSHLANFQLDAVLTPAELQDAALKERAREILTKANGNAWLLWLGIGSVITVVSMLGLQKSRKTE